MPDFDQTLKVGACDQEFGENFLMGGGIFFQKSPNSNLGTSKIQGGGGLNFSKMSEIQKCPNLIRGGGGGQQFSKMSEIQKSLKFQMGGVKPIWEFFPNFSGFFYDRVFHSRL